MPFILPLLYALFLMWLLISLILPTVTTWLTMLILGKSAKLNDEEKFFIGCYFYGVMGLLFAGATVFSYDLSFGEGVWAFIGMLIFWPFTLGFMGFNQPDGGETITTGVIIASFVITQLIAIIMIVKRADKKTQDLD